MAGKNPLLVPELRKLLADGDHPALAAFCRSAHPVTVAELVAALEPAEAWQVLREADPELRAEIFSNLDDEHQVDVVGGLRRGELALLLTEMAPDDRADLFRRLPAERREAVLPSLAQAEREDVRRLAGYAEGTAGAVMTSDYATLRPELTATQAIDHLRDVAPDRETIYLAYVVDERRRLLGYVSLKDLILARRDTAVADIMGRDPVTARADEDQEEAARRIQKYDLLALPVVDADDALVGIITHDDALDVIQQEHTEDLEKFMAIGGSHEAGVYLSTSAWIHFRNRAGWIVGLAALGLVSGLIIHRYELTLTHLLVLALYMPMVADTGGNTGSQSATVVVRALALREIAPRDALRVLSVELRVSVMLAVLLGALSWAKVMFLSQGDVLPAGFALPKVGLAIALALGMQVVTATLIGALLPLGAAKLRLDPAVVASPALTTVVDITGLLIYFTTARVLLGM